jgi:hypothetical protein
MSDACTLLKDPEVCSSISTDEAIQLCYTFKVRQCFILAHYFCAPCVPIINHSSQITQARLDELNVEYDRKNGPIDMGSPVLS